MNEVIELITDKSAADRRASDRFPIEREVRYKVLNKKNPGEEAGVGRTVNMSSNGVLFTSDQLLTTVGRFVR